MTGPPSCRAGHFWPYLGNTSHHPVGELRINGIPWLSVFFATILRVRQCGCGGDGQNCTFSLVDLKERWRSISVGTSMFFPILSCDLSLSCSSRHLRDNGIYMANGANESAIRKCLTAATEYRREAAGFYHSGAAPRLVATAVVAWRK